MILYEDLIKTPPLSSSFALLDVAVFYNYKPVINLQYPILSTSKIWNKLSIGKHWEDNQL